MTSIVTATVIVATTSTTVATDTVMMVVPILPTEYMTLVSTVTHGVLPVGASVVVVVVAEVAKLVVEVATCI